MGDVGGAVCDLGGGVIGGGRSIGSVGSGDASGSTSGRDGADWGESVLEWANPSAGLRDPDRWVSCATSQHVVLLAMTSHTFTRLSTPATSSDMCLGVMSEDVLSSELSSCFGFFLSRVWASPSEASSRSSCFLLLPDAWLASGMGIFKELLLGPANGGVAVPLSNLCPRTTVRCGGTS